MKVLVAYDSQWGNTEKIALAVGDGFDPADDVAVIRAGAVSSAHLRSLDLLIIGAPTQGGRPTKPVLGLLSGLEEHTVQGLRVAAFDTRVAMKFARIFGYAGPRIAEALKAKGAVLIAPAEPFIVKGSEGPLEAGESERAVSWAKELRARVVR
jgi:flavodoxin